MDRGHDGRYDASTPTALYDKIGNTYATTRREDPRIAAQIHEALGGARSVVNVGAGVGSYEPTDRDVLAVEPSETMIAQRPAGAARCVRASAEQLPLDDNSFDAALAINTVQHWTDLRAGLREMKRVARERVVIFLRNEAAARVSERLPTTLVTSNRSLTRAAARPFWLTEDYLPVLNPSAKHQRIAAIIEEELSPQTIPVLLPRDSADGVFTAYWARPEMYLDEEVRRNISNFALAPERDVAVGLQRLRDDLASGAWDRKYGELRTSDVLDLGHRILIAAVSSS
jgi:SAM-dependent methyltransferase